MAQQTGTTNQRAEVPMPESLLQLAWQYRRFAQHNLLTTAGKALTVLNVGSRNLNQGPDFTEARLRFEHAGESLEMHGAIEMHVAGDDWYRHGHHNDPNYNVTILHVVQFASRAQPKRADGSEIPELVLGALLDKNLRERYSFLQHNQASIPCANLIAEVDPKSISTWLQALGWGRLTEKAQYIEAARTTDGIPWQELLWQMLAGALAGPVNKEAFITLARHMPLGIVQRYVAQPEVVQALLLGAAGMLQTLAVDDYNALLQQHWQHYGAKHAIVEMLPTEFKKLRMRPANFPIPRMMQLAAWVCAEPHLLNLLTYDMRTIKRQLSHPVAPYWQQHADFGKPLKKASRQKVSAAWLEIVVLNTLIPIRIAYDRARGDSNGVEQAMDIVQTLTKETNRITSLYASLGIEPKDALESQGMLALYKSYCKPKHCLQCAIGHQILKR